MTPPTPEPDPVAPPPARSGPVPSPARPSAPTAGTTPPSSPTDTTSTRTPTPASAGPARAAESSAVGSLPSLPGSTSESALRTAGSTSRRPTSGAGRPLVDGTAALAGRPETSQQADATDEEALVEAGIAQLWDAYAGSHSKAAKDRLVLHYAPLVKYVAGRVGTGLPAHVDVADLIQCGIFGLVDAIERYEPERGRKFEVYAMQRIRGAILDELRSQDWVPRSVRSRAREIERAIERLESREQRSCTDVELAGELGMATPDLHATFGQIAMTSVAALDELVAAGRGGGESGSGAPSLADSLPDASAEDPLTAMESQETRRLLAEAIEHLAERDRTVVGLYYFENLTLAEIGKVLGVTESRVCQLHTRAVMRLRTRLSEVSHA